MQNIYVSRKGCEASLAIRGPLGELLGRLGGLTGRLEAIVFFVFTHFVLFSFFLLLSAPPQRAATGSDGCVLRLQQRPAADRHVQTTGTKYQIDRALPRCRAAHVGVIKMTRPHGSVSALSV